MLSDLLHRWAGSFFLLFVLFLPFPFFVLPQTGIWLRPISEEIGGGAVHSDSAAMYALVFWLLLAALFVVTVWKAVQNENLSQRLKYIIACAMSYYLALSLLKYGFDKIFKNQFYFPEPNILYTKMGDLSPDILYWSSMGTSYEYSFFAGLIEVIPAVLLLFKKTRTLGALIAVAVLTNVVMINFGFDISVKLYSIFLLGLAIYILLPELPRLRAFFTGKAVEAKEELELKNKKHLLAYSIGKSVIIGLLMIESLGIYFWNNNFYGDTANNELVGAYEIREHWTYFDGGRPMLQDSYDRIYIHSQGHIIFDQDDQLIDFQIDIDSANKHLLIYYPNDTIQYQYEIQQTENSTSLTLQSKQENMIEEIYCTKLQTEELAISNTDFHWTVEEAVADAN